MYSHVTVGTNDFQRSVSFYDAVLSTLSMKQLYFPPDLGWVGYGTIMEAPQFAVGRPFDGKPATFGNGVTVAFNAPNRAVVDKFYAAVLKNGGSDEGKPGLRDYHPNYYGTYVRDPEGNKLCCVCHLPE